MLSNIVPPYVATVAVWSNSPVPLLLEEEAAQILTATESRKREFSAGRWCAREALKKLGYSPTPILRGARHEPIWPYGIVGSITHCERYITAAVAKTSDCRTIGIDAEVYEELPCGVLESIAVEEEVHWLMTAPAGVHWSRIIFSAKEALFKAWYPLTETWLDFKDALIRFEPSESTFIAQIRGDKEGLSDLGLPELKGRFLIRSGVLVTSLVVSPSSD